MLDVVLDNAKIKAIIINLQPLPSHIAYTLKHHGRQLDSADCGFVPRKDETTDYDFVKDFNAGSLQICCKKHYEWQNFVPALPIPSVDPSAQPTLLDMVIAKALSTKGQVNPVKPLALHKLQSAKQHLFLLQRAYSKLTTKSAFYLIREIMKQFGYKVKLENPIRKLTHNRVTNLWELNTEGNIVLTEHDGTTLATTIHFTSSATLSPDVTPYFDKQLIWRNEGPEPQPNGILFKSAEQGFSLQELKINDLSALPPPANQVGVAIIIGAFAAWKSWDHGSCTFLEQVKLSLNSASAFGNKPSPDLASVLTHKLRQVIPTPMTPIQKSAVEKLELALQQEQMEAIKFSDYIKFIPPSASNDAENTLLTSGASLAKTFTLPEIVALNKSPMLATFLELHQFLADSLKQQLLMPTSVTFHPPSQASGLRATTASKTYGFTRETTPGKLGLITLLYQNYSKGCTREAEFNHNFSYKDGGHGFSEDRNAFKLDFERNLQLFGQNHVKWRTKLKENDASIVEDTSAEIIAQKAIEAHALKSVVPANKPKLAQLHLEILKRIYHQSVGKTMEYVFHHTKEFFNLPWSLSTDPAQQNQHNLFYKQDEHTWYFETTMNQLLKVPDEMSDPTAIGKLSYSCTCSFTPPDLSGIDLTQDIPTIMGQVTPKLDIKGFVIDKMTLSMTRSGRSNFEREKHIYLMYLVFKWSITQEEIDRQNLLRFFSGFTS